MSHKKVRPPKVRLSPDQRTIAGLAVRKLLASRETMGATIGEVKNAINVSLRIAVFPTADFGKILFIGRTRKVEERYYMHGYEPPKPKENKKLPEFASQQQQPIPPSELKEQPTTLSGNFDVRVTSDHVDSKYKGVKKLLLFFTSQEE